jgi:hypothetical protein
MAGEEGPDVVTVAEWGPKIGAASFTVLVVLGVSVAPLPAKWPVQVMTGYLVVVAMGSIWAIYRSIRLSVIIDDRGIVVRNFLRTHRLNWPEISCLTDGFSHGGQSVDFLGRDVRTSWVLQVVPHAGRPITAQGTMGGGRPSPATLAAIRQAAGRHGIPAELTWLLPGEQATRALLDEGPPAVRGFHADPGGREGLRCFDGQDWSPYLFLEADPAGSESDDLEALSRVWAPLERLTYGRQPVESDADMAASTDDPDGQVGESYL